MKLGNLKSLGHNVADSVASGIGLLIGVYDMDIFGEASAEKPGYIEVDFLAASTSGSSASRSLCRAIKLYRKVLPDLAAKHDVVFEDIKVLTVRFGSDPVYGQHFTVTVASVDGKRSTDLYVGSPGKRFFSKQSKA